jgi:hypothetical protein
LGKARRSRKLCYPAAGYSVYRSALAKKIGLGRKPRRVEASPLTPAAVPLSAAEAEGIEVVVGHDMAKIDIASDLGDRMLTGAQQHALDQFTKGLQVLGDDALLDTYHQAAEDHRAGQLRPRAATTSAKPTRRSSRPKRRCRIASLIITPATRRDTRELARPDWSSTTHWRGLLYGLPAPRACRNTAETSPERHPRPTIGLLKMPGRSEIH